MSRGATRAALRTTASGLRQLLAVRWVRVLAVLLLLAVATRLALGTLISTVISRLAAQRDLVVSWEDLDLSVSGGSGAVHWLSVASRGPDGEPGAPLVELEYAVFDLNVLHLLRRELSIRRAEVDGADLYLERGADGSWNFERHVAVAEVLSLIENKDRSTRRTAPEEPATTAPIELVPPLAVEALRLQHARLHLVDRELEPERRLSLDTSVWLSSLRTSERKTRFGLEVFGADLLDTARLDGQASWSEDGVSVELGGQVGAQGLEALADYLEPLRVRPVAELLEAAFHAKFELSVVGELRDALAARLELYDARILVDGGDPFTLERMVLQVASLAAGGAQAQALAAGGAQAQALEVRGARGGVELRPDGALRVAGFDLLAPPREPKPPLAWEDVVASVLDLASPGQLPPWIALLGRRDPGAWPWSLERLAVDDCAFQIIDAAVEPPARFALEVATAEVSGIEHDPLGEPRAMTFSARMSAPGLAESISVSGSLLPWAPRRSLDLKLALEGIAPAAADVYLEQTGVERALSNGRLDLELTAEALEEGGVTRGWVQTREVALEDSGELFGVRELAVRDIVVDPHARKLRLGEMVVSGPRLAFVRDPAESFLALGLRLGARAPVAPGADAAVDLPGAPAGVPVTRAPPEPVVLEVGRAAWLDSRVTFVDESTDPPTTFALDEFGIELTDLVLGGDPAGPPPPPARITGGLRAEGLAERVDVEGLVRSRPGTIDLEAEVSVRGEGLRGALLAPYLKPFGITPLLEQGRLVLQAVASLRAAEVGWVVGLRLEQVELSEGDQTLLAVQELDVDELAIGGEGIAVASVTVKQPYARIARDAGGGLALGGVRVEAPPDEDSAPAPVAPAPLALPSLPALRVGAVTVEGARLALADQTFEPALEVELGLDARAGPLSTRSEPGTFELQLGVPGTLDTLEALGTLTLGPELVAIDAALDGSGLQAGPLARLLPPGVSWGDTPGSLQALVSLELRPAEAGGLAARLGARNVALGAGAAAQEPWLACGELSVELARLDPVARVLELGDVLAAGVELEAGRDAAGALHALGLKLAPAPAPGGEPDAVPEPAVRRLPARVDSAPARVAFGDVRLELERFSLHDESLGADARPLAGTLALSLPAAVLLDEDPAGLAPIAWHLEGVLDGLVERWRVDGTLAPFAPEPRLEATLSATGVRTQGLVELAPALAERVTGEVEAGEVSGRLEATLAVRRSHPADLALDRPFGGELHVADVAYRDAPGGAVLLGLDGLDVEIRRIDPGSGDVHLELVELRTPRARLEREGLVVHAAGLAVDLAPPAAEKAATAREPVAGATTREASFPVASQDAAADQAAGGDATAAARAPVLRLDRFVLSGLDVELADRTVSPPLVLPLTHLEFETGRLSRRDLARGGAVSFSGELAAGASDGTPPAFEEVSLAGRIAPLPLPKGWLQLYLSGLELADFSALAAEQGLILDNGALDLSARLRLKGERGAGAGVTLVFSDLDVSEPEGGFLESLLSLPVTLDTALFLLRNADGEHRLSVDVDVGPDGIGAGAMATAAAGAMVQVVAGAVAGAPLRLLGSVVPAGGQDEPRPRDVLALVYAPGSSELDAGELERLAELAWRARTRPSLRVVVRHELTAADLERAALLANPSPEECLELTAGLRQRKAELWRRRDTLSAQARALYAVGAREAEAAAEQLRAVEVELAQVERQLDGVLEVLRADSPRQQAKRARAAARSVAELRLEGVADLLRDALAESRPERLEVRPPRSTPLDEPGGGRVLVELIER